MTSFSTQPTSCEIELSTRCNALCPQCPRSDNGAQRWPGLPLVDLDIDLIQKVLQDPAGQAINFVRLVGTYGDPILHPQMLAVVDMLKQRGIRLLISTNGGVRTVAWWQELAAKLGTDDRVLFCIDGLHDTNHLYRIGVVYEKVIENLRSFNAAGGKSIWQFIVFRHNQHQVDEARQTSIDLGCHGFAFKPTGRFINKSHDMVDRFPVKNKQQQIVHYLEPPNNDQRYLSKNISSYRQNVIEHGDYQHYLKSVPIRCEAIQKKFFAVAAQGHVFPCSFLYDRLYGAEVDGHRSQRQLLDMINANGGFDQMSLHKKSLSEILQSDFFHAVIKSWNSDSRLERCANQCGISSNSLTNYGEIDRLM